MPYTVTASEKTTGSGNENETKALLYLMAFDPDGEGIDEFVIDVFNDVTGANGFATKLWDVQSKKARSSPKLVGAELVTLYKNYVSDFHEYFSKRILFLGGVTTGVIDENGPGTVFHFCDIKKSARNNIRQALIDECYAKTYVDDELVTDDRIDAFLEEVIFVVAETNPAEYIKPLIRVSPQFIPNDNTLRAIFGEIKNKQSAKKNITSEGTLLRVPHEAFLLGKNISRHEIDQLILNRVINGNPFEKGVPKSFVSIYSGIPDEFRDTMLDDCKLDLSRQLFDKNAASSFWMLFEAITTICTEQADLDVNDIYSEIRPEILQGCSHLNTLSAKYFIATIKDGLQ